MTAALAPTVAYSPTKEHILQLNPHASANTRTDMSIVEPAAAANHAEGAPFGANRIGAARQFFAVPIRSPLRHVAVHIVQPPRVGLLQANLSVLLKARVGWVWLKLVSIQRC